MYESKIHPVPEAFADQALMSREQYEQWYQQTYGAALAAALGPEHTDPRAFQVVSALIDPGFRAGLLERGLSQQDAVRETVVLVLAWLDQRGGADG